MVTKSKPKDRTPEIIRRYRNDAAFHRAADTLADLLRAGLSEHDCRDAVRMAVEIQGWSLLDKMRERYGEDAIPPDERDRYGEVPECVTSARANLPYLLSIRQNPDARESARRLIKTIKGFENEPVRKTQTLQAANGGDT